jgi:signal transduction histidine kinase
MMTAASTPVADPVPGDRSTKADGEYQQLMSDLLHDLSQPLSTLTCLLEVNLLLSRPLKQVRHDLKIALQQVHGIVRLFRGLRELVDAGALQQDQERVSLTACLTGIIADLSPLAGAARVKHSASSNSDCVVNFQASRLRQALTHLFEFALSSPAGAKITITTATGRLMIAVLATAPRSVESARENRADGSAAESQREWNRSRGLAVARRIFETGGASFDARDDEDCLRLEVGFPAARSS